MQFSFGSNGVAKVEATSVEDSNEMDGWPAEVVLRRDERGDFVGSVKVVPVARPTLDVAAPKVQEEKPKS